MTDPQSQDNMNERGITTQEGGSGRKDGKQTLSPECKAAMREVVGAIENGVDLSVLSPSVEAATTACSVEIQGLGAIQQFSENQLAGAQPVPAVVEKAKQCMMRNAKPD